MRRTRLRKIVPLFLLGAFSFLASAETPEQLYQQNCLSCHGVNRLGSIGPALLPENLARLRRPEAEKTIREGRPATQMPPFGAILKAEDIQALAAWIYTPASTPPIWGESEIKASRLEHAQASGLPNKPKFSTDPMNLFIVVESGDHHVSILDGDKLEPIHRFQSRFALHGGPKFSPDGRFVYFASRDGWISKYDLWNLTLISEVRAGINTRNAAVSADGKFVAVANYLPHTLVILDADLNPQKIIPVSDQSCKTSSRVSAVYDASPRQSFVAALKDVKELWEISYDPKAPDIAAGMVHDFKYREGAFIPGFLNPKRTQLNDYLDDFFFTPAYDEVMGASRDGGRGVVINLDARRQIAELALPGMPHLGSGISWRWQGNGDAAPRTVIATPNLNQGLISVIDPGNWKLIKTISTAGPGFFLRSHEKSRYAWTDSMMSKEAKDTLQVIDKTTLEVIAKLRPEPGKTLAHIEFTKDGRYALASLWERKADGGAIIVYDAQTLQEVKRISMDKPVGKYNLHNKLTKSEGTSH